MAKTIFSHLCLDENEVMGEMVLSEDEAVDGVPFGGHERAELLFG